MSRETLEPGARDTFLMISARHGSRYKWRAKIEPARGTTLHQPELVEPLEEQTVMPAQKAYQVRAVHCSHQASPEEIYAKLSEVTAPISQLWALGARRSVGRDKSKVPIPCLYRSRAPSAERPELPSSAALRLLRERTDAQLFVIDTSTASPGQRPGPDFNMRPLLEEFGVPYVE
jgi:hypothetical protein